LNPSNNITGPTISELLPMKTTKQDYGKEIMVLDAIYDTSWAWSSLNPVTLV
jgi:hypothetical protein